MFLKTKEWIISTSVILSGWRDITLFIYTIINKYNVLIGYIILINSINIHVHGLLLLIIPKSPPKFFLRVVHSTTVIIINNS